MQDTTKGKTEHNSGYPDYVRRCRRCDKLFHTPCKKGKICDKCTHNPSLTKWHRLSSSSNKWKSCAMCHTRFLGNKWEKYCKKCHKIVYGHREV